MKTVGAYEAKTHFSQLLDEVARGETLTITRHGVPVATLTPLAAAGKLDPAHAVAELRRWRRAQNLSLGALSVRDLPDQEREDATETIEDWKCYQREQNITLGGLSIRELLEEGRQ